MNIAAIAAYVGKLPKLAQQAVLIATTLVDLINTVEDAFQDLKGNQKLAAVRDGMKTFLTELGLDDEFDAMWKRLSPLVSMIVSAYNALGVFKRLTK